MKVKNEVHKRQQKDNSDTAFANIGQQPSANGMFLDIKRRTVQAYRTTKIGKRSAYDYCHSRQRGSDKLTSTVAQKK